MKNYILIGILVSILSCCHLPEFGTPGKCEEGFNRLQAIWFSNMPHSYVMKHFVSISFTKNQPKQIDFFGYVLVKNGDFRIIAMNDLGLTVLDVFSEKKAENLVIVKKWDKIENTSILKQIAKDIYYIFSSQYELDKQPLPAYSTNDHSCLFLKKEESCTWHAWEMKDNRPFKIRHGEKGNENSSTTFDYSDGVVNGFPKKIAVVYPLSGVHIQIQILSLQSKEISHEQFVPTIPSR